MSRKLKTDMKPWDWLNIFNQKSITLKEIKEDYENNQIYENQFNPYMILLGFSNSPYFNMIVNYINTEYNDDKHSKDFLFKYLYYAIPKNKYFIKWTKKQKEDLVYKLNLSEVNWNEIFPDMPFDKIDTEIMKHIQKELGPEFTELEKELNKK